jgi:hypothetical protein
MISKELLNELKVTKIPRGRRIVPIDSNYRGVSASTLNKLACLGYDSCEFDSGNNKKLWDDDKYETIALEVMSCYEKGIEPPKEYIDYMLEVKKIKEEHGLL